MRSSPLRIGNAMPPRRPALLNSFSRMNAPLARTSPTQSGWPCSHTRPGSPVPLSNANSALARSNAPKSRSCSRHVATRRSRPLSSMVQNWASSRPSGRAIAASSRGAASSKLSDSASARATPYWTCRRAASRSRSVRSRAISTDNMPPTATTTMPVT